MPQPPTDLVFKIIEELELRAFAVVVVQSRAEGFACAAAPEPAGLHDQVAAEVEFFAQLAVEGGERRAAPAGGAGLGVVEAELEFPRRLQTELAV